MSKISLGSIASIPGNLAKVVFTKEVSNEYGGGATRKLRLAPILTGAALGVGVAGYGIAKYAG